MTSGVVLLLALLPMLAAAGAPAAAASGSSAVTRATIDPALAGRHGVVKLIVRDARPGNRGPEQALRALGGRVTRELPIIDGFAGKLPAAALGRFALVAGIRDIALDRPARVQSTTSSGAVQSVYPAVIRAPAVWRAGITGSGVNVALIDTGVTVTTDAAGRSDLAGRLLPVTDLTGVPSNCENLSGEPDCSDSYGHGTFMAGIIAGNGSLSFGAHKGVAPGAGLVSVKVAGRDGSADVSTVLSAIQWVVSFKDRYNIRVLNLSLGTDSTQSYRDDPFDYAVERAWSAGIVVVVSVSNRGPLSGTISKPADDPFVISVGAIDDRGTPYRRDDLLPNFSSRGPTYTDGFSKPDLVAPGANIVSLRSPGSLIDTTYPGSIDGWYHMGSGTSMSTAVVSGVAALALQANPAWTPARVKYALTTTAHPDASDDPLAAGSGVVDAYATSFLKTPGLADDGLSASTGMGPLALSRGTTIVQDDDLLATVVTGEETAQLLAWSPSSFTPVRASFLGSWDPTSWYLSLWYLAPVYRTTWSQNDWAGSNWHWNGATSGGHWVLGVNYGGVLPGSTWYGAWQ